MRRRATLLFSLVLALSAWLVPPPALAAETATVALHWDTTSLPPRLPATHAATPGEALTTSGTVPAGTTTLTVQRATGSGAWTSIIGQVTFGPDQVYWARTSAPTALGSYRYRAVARVGSHTVTSGAWTLDVIRQTNAFQFTAPRFTQVVEGVGTVSPARPTVRLNVQTLSGGAWRTVANVPQDARGGYHFRVLATALGNQTYRTVPQPSGTGAPPLSAVVLPPTPLTPPVDLTHVDTLASSGTVVTGEGLQLGSGTDHGSVQWLLPAGLRTFSTTLRWTGPAGSLSTLVGFRTEDRLLFVTTLPPGGELPVTLDVTGASSLVVWEDPDPLSEWTSVHAQLVGPRLSGPRGPVLGRGTGLQYLADLEPSETDPCLETGYFDAADSPYPGSVYWHSGAGSCAEETATEYRLAGRYDRFRATAAARVFGGGIGDLNAGVLTVAGDGRVLGTFPVGSQFGYPSEQPIDLDVTGVDRLRFVFSRNPDTGTGDLVLGTPVLTRR